MSWSFCRGGDIRALGDHLASEISEAEQGDDGERRADREAGVSVSRCARAASDGFIGINRHGAQGYEESAKTRRAAAREGGRGVF